MRRRCSTASFILSVDLWKDSENVWRSVCICWQHGRRDTIATDSWWHLVASTWVFGATVQWLWTRTERGWRQGGWRTEAEPTAPSNTWRAERETNIQCTHELLHHIISC